VDYAQAHQHPHQGDEEQAVGQPAQGTDAPGVLGRADGAAWAGGVAQGVRQALVVSQGSGDIFVGQMPGGGGVYFSSGAI